MEDEAVRRRPRPVSIILLLILVIISLIGEAMRDRATRFWLSVIVSGLLILVVSVSLLVGAHARDYGQWEGSDPTVHKWYQELMRPDVPSSPCCTEADAYWADEFYVRDGKMFARITDERPDSPLGRPHIDNGTEFEVPKEKLKYSDGNPTGHGVLFVSTAGFTWCYVMPGGV